MNYELRSMRHEVNTREFILHTSYFLILTFRVRVLARDGAVLRDGYVRGGVLE